MKLFKFDYFLKCCLVLLFAVGMGNTAWAQRTISGTITDGENNEPLIGANILVVGTSTGTVTDLNGAYSVEVPEGASEIEITYTGYGAKKVTLGTSNIVDIVLTPGELLDEVVVVGYGSVRKTDATGAVTSVTEKDFNKGIITSPEQLLQGRAAGVQITSASGEPGGGINVRIRGTSSVRNGNNPLFVVDGVPLTGDNSGSGVEANGANTGLGSSSARNPLNFINPSDIASIDILKDASATAIYGSRGANGVVIITTKSGAAGKSTLGYDFSVGFATITKKYDLLGASEFLDAYATFNGQDAANSLNGGATTDWQDEMFRTGITHSHTLTYGGGDQNGNFRFSLAYFDQEGIIEESGLQRISARFNGTRNFFDSRLKISTQMTIANTHDDNVAITDNSGFEGDLLGNILKANPTLPIFDVNDIDGDGDTEEYTQPSNTEPNPVAINNLSDGIGNTLRALGNVSAELKLTEELSFKTIVGFDRSFYNRIDAFSSDLVATGITGQGRLFNSDVNLSSKLWENYFTYTKNFGNVDFTGLLGYSYQEFRNSAKQVEMTNFRTNDLDVMMNNSASADQGTLGSVVLTNSLRNINELQSFFGRVNLGIQSKYLLTLTLRADGSTRFGDNNKYGYFPSAAFKWRVIEESFVPEVFDDLGLRLGYGVTGNQGIPHNLFTSRQRYSNFDIDDGGNVGGGGIESITFENPDLQWETTTQFNLGLDFAFFNYRLSGSLDFYNKNTTDLLFQIQSAQPAPNEFSWANLDAEVINKGAELSLNIVAVDKSDFRWNVLFNAAYNKNEVQNFGGLVNTGDIDGQGLTGAFAQRIAEGQPLYAYFLREFAGYDDNGISIYAGGDFQKFTGDSPLPTTNLGLTNTFSYKDFDFSFFFNGVFGHSVYSNTANAFFTAGSLANGRNVSKDVVGNGESNLNAPDVSTRFLEKADFIRLQNLSLGYTVNTSGIEAISSLRFSITGQNLFVITDYSGQDPEVDVNKQIDGVPSFGIDYTAFPRARTWTIGASIQF